MLASLGVGTANKRSADQPIALVPGLDAVTATLKDLSRYVQLGAGHSSAVYSSTDADDAVTCQHVCLIVRSIPFTADLS
jgi:hypothetical protein